MIINKEDVISFEEREKRSAEIRARLQETFPMAGNISGEDVLWRSLTANVNRDLNSLTQKRMQEIAFYLFDTNPMAHRTIEIIRDFVIGDGFTYTAEDDGVLEVIDKFWNDPDNNLDITIDENVLELCLFGENCFPVWVNPADGFVKLGYVDPARIIKVIKDKKQPRINDRVLWKNYKSMDINKELKIIRFDYNENSETFGKRTGDAFYFAINKPISGTRGRSDLLCLADWLDGYDQFLFARLERAFLLNTYIWDITCEGMNKPELEEFVKGITMPKPGSIRAHNEKIKWDALAPKLEASDASDEARLFKNQILGGAGFPEHWFAEGSRTTRATALEMGLPTLKKLKSRQRLIKFQYTFIIDFVLDQAILHGTLKENVNRRFKIIPSPIVSRDNRGLASSISSFVDGLIKAVEKKWITDKEAENALKVMISQVGVEAFSAEKEKIGENNEQEEEIDEK